MKVTLYIFKEQNQIKDTMNIHEFINPLSKRAEDSIDDANLVKDIITNYSVTPAEVPNIDPDPIILIRPAQALVAI
jgi:hypothetical protein